MAVASAGEAGGMQMQAELCTDQATRRIPFGGVNAPPGVLGAEAPGKGA